MSLLDELNSLRPQPKPQGCKTCLWLSNESDDVRQRVAEWAVNEYSHTQLYRALVKFGYPLSLGALKNHMSSCYV